MVVTAVAINLHTICNSDIKKETNGAQKLETMKISFGLTGES